MWEVSKVVHIILLLIICQSWAILGNKEKDRNDTSSSFQNVSPAAPAFNIIPTNTTTTSFHGRAVLDGRKGRYILEWTMDMEKSRAFFNITAKTTGWVALGLTERGSMSEADLVIGGVRVDGQTYLSDMHTDCKGGNLSADGSQDWKLFEASESGGWTNLVIYRDFDTCDKDDYPITTSQMFLMWAYGETDEMEYPLHPVVDNSPTPRWNPGNGNRGVFRVFLLDPVPVPPVPSETNLSTWSFRSNITIPPKETQYLCTIHRGPSSLPTKHHIVQLDPYLQNTLAVSHTKHIRLFECVAPPGGTAASQLFEPLVGYGEECYFISNRSRKIPLNLCRTLVATWAVGGDSIVLDPSTGIEFGGGEERYYMTEIHLDNPEQLPGISFRAGMDVQFTPNLRRQDGGSILFGYDPFGTFAIPPASPRFLLQGHCTSECSHEVLPPGGVEILGVSLHMRSFGWRITLRHYRNDKELPNIARDDNYDPTFQRYRTLPKPVTFLPGDHLLLDCRYDATSSNTTILGGFSQRQETCQSFLMLNQRIPTFSCSSIVPHGLLLGSLFGVHNLTWDMGSGEKRIISTSPPLLEHNGTLLLLQDYLDDTVEWGTEARYNLMFETLTIPQVGLCPSNHVNVVSSSEGMGYEPVVPDLPQVQIPNHYMMPFVTEPYHHVSACPKIS